MQDTAFSALFAQTTPHAALLAALNEEGDDLFDLLAFDPCACEAAPLATDGDWPCCPWHGFHEAEEDGTPLSYCTRCERRL